MILWYEHHRLQEWIDVGYHREGVLLTVFKLYLEESINNRQLFMSDCNCKRCINPGISLQNTKLLDISK